MIRRIGQDRVIYPGSAELHNQGKGTNASDEGWCGIDPIGWAADICVMRFWWMLRDPLGAAKTGVGESQMCGMAALGPASGFMLVSLQLRNLSNGALLHRDDICRTLAGDSVSSLIYDNDGAYRVL